MRIARLEVLAATAIAVCCLALALHHNTGPVPEAALARANDPGSAFAPADQAPLTRPRIEVVFVVDTTSSMGGLLEGAKQKIWAIANRLASGEPRPDLRVGLVAYRDRGDDYITKKFDFSGDMDAVYAELLGYQAVGGGDSPEHVGQGLHDALHKMQWTRGDGVLRLIFLVGDAPPHDDYQDGTDTLALAQQARARGILINTIRCGDMPDTEAVWRKISAAAGGEFTSIAQDGGVVAVETPYDQALFQLNQDLSRTVLSWGDADAKHNSMVKLGNRATMSVSAAAEAASYSAKAARLNDEDLISALDGGKQLAEIADNELPDAMQAMSADQRTRHVDELRGQRAALNAKILEVSKQRDAFLRDAEKAAGAEDSFDGQVVQTLRAQAKSVGVAY